MRSPRPIRKCREAKNDPDVNKAEHKKGDINISYDTNMAGKKIDDLYELMSTMRTELNEFRQNSVTKSEVQKINDEISKINEKIDDAITNSTTAVTTAEQALKLCQDSDNKITSLETQLEAANTQNDNMAKKVFQLTEKLNKLESYNRRENLLFDGIKQEPEEDCEKVMRKFFQDKLGIFDDIKFQRVHRLPYNKDPNPIICSFVLFSDRQNVWQAKKKLKDTKFFISEDLPADYIQRRRILQPILREARKQKKLVHLRDDRLVLEGKVYSIDTVHELPDDLQPKSLATKTFDNVTAFFGGLSPLSNFHPVKITVDGKQFLSTEQYLQWHKAYVANQPAIMKKIMESKTPLQAKQLGDKLNLTKDIWLPEAKAAIHNACKAKFTQNDSARAFLLNTGNTQLIEASKDPVWGIGMSLHDKNLTDRTKWTGGNLLGEVLTEIRKYLNDTGK